MLSIRDWSAKNRIYDGSDWCYDWSLLHYYLKILSIPFSGLTPMIKGSKLRVGFRGSVRGAVIAELFWV